MFKKLKTLFKAKPRKRKKYETAQEVSFFDLAGKEVKLEIRINGNDTLLAVKDEKNNSEIMLDKELVTLIDVLLQSYILHEVFPNLEEG